MHPQHKKEHNFSALFLTALVLVLVLVAGAKGHTKREVANKAAGVPVVKEAIIPVVARSQAFLLQTTKPPVAAPAISAAAALVEDIDSEKVLYDFHSDKQWSAASLTKLMTALAALEYFNDEQLEELDFDEGPMVKVSQRAIATESSAGNLVAGRSYLLMDLLRVMLVFSSNDASVAIGEYFSGLHNFSGYDYFVGLMNDRAEYLHMTDTRFFDTSGLSPLNLTTAKDMEKLVSYVYREQRRILEITREKVEGGTHPFAGEADFLGGKTGFIDESAGNLISLFNYQGRPIMIIVLGSKDRAADTKILKDWFLRPLAANP